MDRFFVICLKFDINFQWFNYAAALFTKTDMKSKNILKELSKLRFSFFNKTL